jgi:CsoR family transcriptional regulator, copper-sensing transcriptional repressor
VTPAPATSADVWERRLRKPVIAAALAVLPLLALSLTHPHGVWHTVEEAGHWAVWTVFAVEVVVMLAVVDDRRAWISDHRFDLLVVAASSPVVPLALAVAPALRLLIVVKAFKTLKVAKAVKLAKLSKSVRLLHRRLTPSGLLSVALGILALALGALTAASMLTDDPPLSGSGRTVALVAAGMLATFGVNHLHRRASGA